MTRCGFLKASGLLSDTTRGQRRPRFQLGLLPALQTFEAHFHGLEVTERVSRALSNC